MCILVKLASRSIELCKKYIVDVQAIIHEEVMIGSDRYCEFS